MIARIVLTMALLGVAHPSVAQTVTRTNINGPTVSQIHAFMPRIQASGRAFPTPLQSGGPFPFWFTVEPQIAVAFLDCSPDGHCDRWIMFSVVEALTEAQTLEVRQGWALAPLRERRGERRDPRGYPLRACMYTMPDAYQILYQRLDDINPQADSLAMITPRINNSSSPSLVADQLDAFRPCATLLREIVAEVKSR